jgi:hypothetical protein
MINPLRAIVAVSLAVGLAGCGGHYVLSAPDQVAPAGQDAPIVIRLQRNDFFVMDMAWEDAPIRFRINQGPQRAAYTDEEGYAGTLVPAPAEPGRHVLSIDYKDLDGQDVFGQAAVFVFNPSLPMVAVDFESLKLDDWWQPDSEAAEALRKIATVADIVYLTRWDVDKHQRAYELLRVANCPIGPLLRWERRRYKVVPGRFGMPKLEFGAHLVSQLDALMETFPGLAVGITNSPLSATAFAEAGLRTYMVDAYDLPEGYEASLATWSELGTRLPAGSPLRRRVPPAPVNRPEIRGPAPTPPDPGNRVDPYNPYDPTLQPAPEPVNVTPAPVTPVYRPPSQPPTKPVQSGTDLRDLVEDE